MVTPDSEGSLPSPNLLRNTLEFVLISRTRLSRSLVTDSTIFCYQNKSQIKVLQPPAYAGFELFPLRSSLTKGITYVFFSSGYLDISVPQVPPESDSVSRVSTAGISPFGHRRIEASWQLPDDYRGLVRPSSARNT